MKCGKMSMLSNVQTFDIKHYENVKSFFEHIGLYVGLVAYTAVGAKVTIFLPVTWELHFLNVHTGWGVWSRKCSLYV